MIKNEYVVKVLYHYKLIDKWPKYLSHDLYECTGCICKPKGHDKPLKTPFVLNVVFHLSLGWRKIWLYPLWRSNFENTYALCRISSMSSKRGMEKLYFTVIWLIAWLSMHMHQLSSFLSVSSVTTTQGLRLSCCILCQAILALVVGVLGAPLGTFCRLPYLVG